MLPAAFRTKPAVVIMSNRIRVGILFGGRSAEHEVSLRSAKNIVEAMDKKKYEPVLIGIDREGRWSLIDDTGFFSSFKDPFSITVPRTNRSWSVMPFKGTDGLICSSEGGSSGPVDVVFPVLHGTFGEDGTVQGLLKLADVPFVGASVLGSSAGMDKDVMKRLLREASVPGPEFLVFEQPLKNRIDFFEVKKALGLPLFVKPANLGSSVGISKVSRQEDFITAVLEAFRFDNKIIIEEFIDGREIECSVLGNDDPVASVPGEIRARHEFYTYEAKYTDDSGAELEIPAKISVEHEKKIRELAVRTFKVLCCEGMARVDLFLKENGEVFVNEINTLPGFTNISMYPKLWEASGIPQTELISKLIDLAIERFNKEKKLRRSY
jgi:D-alanine-D-alanine ligase